MLTLEEDGKSEEKRRMMRSLRLVRHGKAMLQLLRTSKVYIR